MEEELFSVMDTIDNALQTQFSSPVLAKSVGELEEDVEDETEEIMNKIGLKMKRG